MAQPASHTCLAALLLVAVGLQPAVLTAAAPPTADLLPASTQGLICIPDVAAFQSHWSATQLGQLVQDPAMKPFVEDLREQMRQRWVNTGARLGLKWEDFQGLAAGEVAMALTVAEGEQPYAAVLTVDVGERMDQARAALDKIAAEVLQRGGNKSSLQLGGQEVTLLKWELKQPNLPAEAHHTYYSLHNGLLVACDDAGVLAGILQRAQTAVSGQPATDGESVGPAGSLGQTKAYTAIRQRCAQSTGEMQPHARWFLNPMGYARLMKAARGNQARRGRDLLKVFENQGFGAVEAMGGVIVLDAGELDVQQHAMIYAPQPTMGDRFRLAARMLSFPNAEDGLAVPGWVPAEVTAATTFNWRMRDAFEFSKSLVNELLNAEEGQDLFGDVLDGIATDPLGPQVDLRKELIEHLADRATFIADHKPPASPDSERWLFAVAVKDTQVVTKTIRKLMEAEPDTRRREAAGHVIWEILESEQSVAIEPVQIGGLGLPQLDEQPEPGREERIITNLAISVSRDGHLMFSSSPELLIQVLEGLDDAALAKTPDYDAIDQALKKISPVAQSFRQFSRTDKAYEVTYELLRTGRMPESESVFGRLLNRWLGTGEEGVHRKQQIDGSKMPAFNTVRHYFGPSGYTVSTEPDGWFISACLLKRQNP